MAEPRKPIPPEEQTSTPFQKETRRRWARFREAMDLRERLWDVLNALEASRGLRIRIYLGTVVVALLTIAGIWFYPRWREENSIQMVRQWLAADKLERAAEALEVAMNAAPDRPEVWTLASELAQRSGLARPALVHARHASNLATGDAALAMDWAATAIAAGDGRELELALARVRSLGAGETAAVKRMLGERARQARSWPEAVRWFDEAVALEPGEALGELPLAVSLVGRGAPDDLARARVLLSKWSNDPVWGLEATRQSLALAYETKNSANAVALAESLIARSDRQQGDTLNALLALAEFAPDRFAAALADEQTAAAQDPVRAAGLVDWLSGTGRAEEAWRWVRTMTVLETRSPPLVVSIADALRTMKNWTALAEWSGTGDWGAVDFVRRAYAALASRNLGDTERAAAQWQNLRDAARIRGGQAFFLAGLVYTWGWTAEAVELWEATSRLGGLALNSYGALARHFQTVRDADGQYRAFVGLRGLRVADAEIANNFAYFAAVMNRELANAERIARGNFDNHPGNLAYRSTLAFVVWRQGRSAEALALLTPVDAELRRDPALAMTYGLVLASSGRREEALRLLSAVDQNRLSLQEAELVARALQ